MDDMSLSPPVYVTSMLSKRRLEGYDEETKVRVLQDVFQHINLNCYICKLRVTDPIGFVCSQKMYRVCSQCFQSQTLCSVCNTLHKFITINEDITTTLVNNLPKITTCGISLNSDEHLQAHVNDCVACLQALIKQRDTQIRNIKKYVKPSTHQRRRLPSSLDEVENVDSGVHHPLY